MCGCGHKGVRQRFVPLLQKAKQNECDDWVGTARGRLALIIVLDQFPHHVYRNTPDAFAQDAKAQQLCLEGIEAGQDKQLTFAERHFFYVPLMHAESLELQALSVEKFTELRNEAEAILGFAKSHRSIVERFGRFPHRNKILGRVSTTQEEAFLVSGENRFA